MGVERVTITIKKDVLERIDSMIDGKGIRNRSHAVENLILKSLGRKLDTVLILAGGEGTKLASVKEVPKPLIPVHGKPILEHQINLLKKYGIRNIILSVGYMHNRIREYFGNGSRFDVGIEYIVEKKPLGTAGPIGLVKDQLTDSFALLNVDTLMNPDINEMYQFHKKEGTLATVLLVTVDNPSLFGVAKMRGNRILGFVGRPSLKNAPSRLVHAGFCIFEPDVINFIPKGRFMIEDLFQRLAKREAISGFVHDGPIYDVGTAEGYSRAIKNWKDI
jgi:NDP-sugar pyrophosphorylase family protein